MTRARLTSPLIRSAQDAKRLKRPLSKTPKPFNRHIAEGKASRLHWQNMKCAVAHIFEARSDARLDHVSKGSIVVDLISSIDKSAVTLCTRTSEISA